MEIRHMNQNALAARWAISPRTLERWRWAGIGPLFIKLGGRVVYRLKDVEAFEAEQIRQATPNASRSQGVTNTVAHNKMLQFN
jgi:predicted site-specific integrase-resolvase